MRRTTSPHAGHYWSRPWNQHDAGHPQTVVASGISTSSTSANSPSMFGAWSTGRLTAQSGIGSLSLWTAEGTKIVDLADALGIQAQALGRKLHGQRRWYLDEVLTIANTTKSSLDFLIRGIEPAKR